VLVGPSGSGKTALVGRPLVGLFCAAAYPVAGLVAVDQHLLAEGFVAVAGQQEAPALG
jgi:hypothetical protein